MEKDKLSKARRGLEACSHGLECAPECPYEWMHDEPGAGNCIAALALDALKELETCRDAKMLTYNQAINHASDFGDKPDSVRPVFVQFRDEIYQDEATTPPWRGGVNQRKLLKDPKRYYVYYVFWTERPTREQMEDVEWMDKD